MKSSAGKEDPVDMFECLSYQATAGDRWGEKLMPPSLSIMWLRNIVLRRALILLLLLIGGVEPNPGPVKAPKNASSRQLVAFTTFVEDSTLVASCFRRFRMMMSALYSLLPPGSCWECPNTFNSRDIPDSEQVGTLMVRHGRGSGKGDPPHLVRMRWTQSGLEKTLVQCDWTYGDGSELRYLRFQMAAYRWWFLATETTRAALATESIDCSHICHNQQCANPWHLVLEPKPMNQSRNSCHGTTQCGHTLRCAIPGPHVSGSTILLTTTGHLSLVTPVNRLTVDERVRRMALWQSSVRGEGAESELPLGDPNVGSWVVSFAGPRSLLSAVRGSSLGDDPGRFDDPPPQPSIEVRKRPRDDLRQHSLVAGILPVSNSDGAGTTTVPSTGENHQSVNAQAPGDVIYSLSSNGSID